MPLLSDLQYWSLYSAVIIEITIYASKDLPLIENDEMEMADILFNEGQGQLYKGNFKDKRAIIKDMSHLKGKGDVYLAWTNGRIPYKMHPKINGKSCYCHVHPHHSYLDS